MRNLAGLDEAQIEFVKVIRTYATQQSKSNGNLPISNRQNGANACQSKIGRNFATRMPMIMIISTFVNYSRRIGALEA